MRLRVLTSIRAKLFYLISGVVILTVSGNSWQNSRSFRSFLDRQIEDALMVQARNTAGSVAGIFESWGGQIAVLMHGLDFDFGEASRQQAASFVASNRDFLAFHLFRVTADGNLEALVSATTEDRTSPRFEAVDPNEALALLGTALPKRLIPELRTRAKDPVIVLNPSPDLGLPIASIAVVLAVGASANGPASRILPNRITMSAKVPSELRSSPVIATHETPKLRDAMTTSHNS